MLMCMFYSDVVRLKNEHGKIYRAQNSMFVTAVGELEEVLFPVALKMALSSGRIVTHARPGGIF